VSTENSSLDDFAVTTPEDNDGSPDQHVDPREIRAGLTSVVSERHSSPETRRPAWTPNYTPANECAGCGAHVSREFARTSSDADGVVHACPSCTTGTEIRNGAAAGLDYDRVQETHTPLRGGGF
jgi:hypothetical protein